MRRPEEDGGLRGGLAFSYRLLRPGDADGSVLVALHGSGVDETTLLPFAAGVAPRATLLAPRGRVPQDGGWRWFERITPTRFGQRSIREEVAAFAGFVARAAALHGLNLGRAAFLGYSNGANVVSSLMLLHPGIVRRAALLRAMPVLDEPPPADLSGTRVLVLKGAADATYGPYAPALVRLLRAHGARVTPRTIAAGHEFGEEDARILRRWLGE